jgi:hypothetical protein
MPLQEPLADIGIPDRQRDRHELAAGTGLRQQLRDQSRGAPAGQPQAGDEQGFHHDAAVDDMRGQCDRKILWRRPRSRDQAESAVGEVRPRRGDRVA